MRSVFRVAGGTLVLCLSCLLLSGTEAGANYRFDDLFGPSGVGAQWMVITGGMDTVGDAAAQVPMKVSGDIVSDRNSVVIMNGRTEEPLGDEANRDIRAMFLVLTGTQASMKVGFDYSGPGDAVTPDGLVDNPFYSTRKTPLGSGGYDFLFVKDREQGKFGSVRGNFAFHQNHAVRPHPGITSYTRQVRHHGSHCPDPAGSEPSGYRGRHICGRSRSNTGQRHGQTAGRRHVHDSICVGNSELRERAGKHAPQRIDSHRLGTAALRNRVKPKPGKEV